jgi:hypothetical protein
MARTAPFVSTLTVDVYGGAVSGETHFRISAAPEGLTPQYRDITVIVLATWILTVTPSSKDVLAGDPVGNTYEVIITGSIFMDPNIHLSAEAPIAATFEFSANDQPAPFMSTMRVRADPAAPLGPRLITVNADPVGSEPPQSRQVTMVVKSLVTIPTIITSRLLTPTVWDLVVSPVSRNVAPGGSTSFAVSITGSSGGTSIQLVAAAIGISWAFSVNNQPAPFDSIMTVSVPAGTPEGSYEMKVFGHPVGTSFPGPDDKVKVVTVIVVGGSGTGGAATTDWAVLSVASNPAAPRPGDAVTFSMTMTLLSTTGTFPQTVDVQCTVDGVSCGSGTVSHSGPVGVPMNVHTESPWIAVAGTHSLIWVVSGANDPNPGNDIMTTSFTTFAETTTASAISSSPVEASTTRPATAATQSTSQILTATVQPTTSIAQPAVETVTKIPGGEILETAQQNSLPIITVLALLIVILVALIFRRRKTKPGE